MGGLDGGLTCPANWKSYKALANTGVTDSKSVASLRAQKVCADRTGLCRSVSGRREEEVELRHAKILVEIMVKFSGLILRHSIIMRISTC